MVSFAQLGINRTSADVPELAIPGDVSVSTAASLATVFDNLKPHAVVTIADRYETMATAVCAAYMNIPLAHVQGGEVTGADELNDAAMGIGMAILLITHAMGVVAETARRVVVMYLGQATGIASLATIGRAAAWQHKNIPVRLTSSAWRQAWTG